MNPRIPFLACLFLAACGGSGEERPATFTPNTEPVSVAGSVVSGTAAGGTGYLWKPAGPLSPIRKDAVAAPVALKAATSDEASFVLEDEEGLQGSTFELHPVRGRGYPELKLTMKARRIGDTAAAAEIAPSCVTTTRCEYNLAKKYAVVLPDDKVLKLVARNGAAALVATELSLDVPKAVEVRLVADNALLSTRRVLLLTD